jgi:murein DD-endopeptidase MepM/ murein hydrolase activator NlpD
LKFPFDVKKITGRFGTLSEFRKKNGMQPHSGVDWAMPENTPIPAIDDGTVVLSQFSKVLGNVVVQRVMAFDPKADKEKQEIFFIGYCHLAKPGLPVGTKVAEGETIGLVGGGPKTPSGSASTGAHLHLTVSKELKGVFGPTSVKQDPIEFIKANK